jgi:hypothetical protein
VTELLDQAGRIYETATSTAAGSDELAILIGPNGEIRMVAASDWPLDSLQREHGAREAYCVRRNGGEVSVEGRSLHATCLLRSHSAAQAARRLLGTGPRYQLVVE